MPAFFQTYASCPRLRRAALSQGRAPHSRREESRIVKAGYSIAMLSEEYSFPLLLIKNSHWNQRNLGMGCVHFHRLFPPPSYLNLLLMVQSTLFWVMAFCCNLKTHTSRKLNPEGKSTVIRGFIFWYFPYVARIYIKMNCHRWFHKGFRRPFKQTHPSTTKEKHSARN